MKQILFATTALVASTGFAMADVDITGFAEMGIFGGEDSSGDSIDTQFHTDIDATFTMTGETDAGLTFGASVDLDESIGDNNADDGLDESGATRDDSDDGGATFFVSGSLGTLTMGDTDGAFDFAMAEAIIGASLQDENEHLGYNLTDGNRGLDGIYDGQVARYDYSFGAFSIAVSAEIDDDNDQDTFDAEDFDQLDEVLQSEAAEIDNDTVLGIGLRYAGTFGASEFGVGVGYQRAGRDTISVFDDDGNALDPTADDFDADDVDDVDIDGDSVDVYGLSFDISMDNGFQGVINYSAFDNYASTGRPAIDDHYGIAAGYEFGALLIALNYGVNNMEEGDDNTGYALVANYDLGGGTQLQGGYGSNNPAEGDSYDRFAFGIAMSF